MEVRPKIAAEIAQLRQAFRESGAVLVKEVLDEAGARDAHQRLASHQEWFITIKEPARVSGRDCTEWRVAEWERMSARQKRTIINDLHERAAASFEMYFKQYPLIEKFRIGEDGDVPIMRIARLLVSGAFLELIGNITGIDGLTDVTGMASRFDAGHFILSHTDRQPEGSVGRREVAFVLYLTEGWRDDWGAHTCLWSEGSAAAVCIPPRFNTMLIFRVPRAHSVLYVPPFVTASRLALAGWAYSRT
jgi:Rps23 Pro-64 3,4-dihydroxylase Tpa1-like proline 4-hydroxylase